MRKIAVIMPFIVLFFLALSSCPGSVFAMTPIAVKRVSLDGKKNIEEAIREAKELARESAERSICGTAKSSGLKTEYEERVSVKETEVVVEIFAPGCSIYSR